MSRVYEFLFRSSRGDAVKAEGHGNTRRSAEQHARRKLRDDWNRDPMEFYTAKVTFVRRS